MSIPIETLRSWLNGDPAQTAETENNDWAGSTQCNRQPEQDDWADHAETNSPDDLFHPAETDESITIQNDTSLQHIPTTERNNNVSGVASFIEEDSKNMLSSLPEFPGITPGMMLGLVKQYSINRVRAVIAYARQQTNLHNPAGFIVARVKDNKLGLEHPDQIYTSSLLDDGKRFISGEYADFIKH